MSSIKQPLKEKKIMRVGVIGAGAISDICLPEMREFTALPNL